MNGITAEEAADFRRRLDQVAPVPSPWPVIPPPHPDSQAGRLYAAQEAKRLQRLAAARVAYEKAQAEEAVKAGRRRAIDHEIAGLKAQCQPFAADWARQVAPIEAEYERKVAPLKAQLAALRAERKAIE